MTDIAPLSGDDATLLRLLRSIAHGGDLALRDLLSYGIGDPPVDAHTRKRIEHAIYFLRPSPLADAAQLARILAYLTATGEVHA